MAVFGFHTLSIYPNESLSAETSVVPVITAINIVLSAPVLAIVSQGPFLSFGAFLFRTLLEFNAFSINTGSVWRTKAALHTNVLLSRGAVARIATFLASKVAKAVDFTVRTLFGD